MKTVYFISFYSRSRKVRQGSSSLVLKKVRRQNIIKKITKKWLTEREGGSLYPSEHVNEVFDSLSNEALFFFINCERLSCTARVVFHSPRQPSHQKTCTRTSHPQQWQPQPVPRLLPAGYSFPLCWRIPAGCHRLHTDVMASHRSSPARGSLFFSPS